MAKVTGGLFSLDASGKFANSLIFDRRGYVRTYRIPANPKTGSQGDVRLMLKSAQKAIKVCANDYLDLVKESAPTQYRWNSFMVSKILGKSHDTWDGAETAWLALSDENANKRAAWETAAESLGLTDASLSYSDMGTVSKGRILYALAYAHELEGWEYGAYTPGSVTAASTDPQDWADFVNQN